MSEEKNEEVEILDEYDFSNAVIGKYAKQYADGTNIVVLEPDVAKVFPDSAAVKSSFAPAYRTALTLIPRRIEQAFSPDSSVRRLYSKLRRSGQYDNFSLSA